MMMMPHHRMMMVRYFMPLLARDRFRPNQPAVIENCSVQRLMLAADNARHLDEIIGGRPFDALYVGRMDVGCVVETARHRPPKIGQVIRIK